MTETFSIPTSNKEVLLNPSYEELPGLINLNKQKLQSYDFAIYGIPYSEFRKQVRSEILRKAGEYTERMLSICSELNIEHKNGPFADNYSSDSTIIQTGHAPTLAHPGVLIKNSLTSNLAKKVNGVGINMIVDNDVCHDNYINIPNIDRVSSTIEQIEFMPRTHNLAFEEIGHTDPKQLNAFQEYVLRVISNPDMKETFNNFMDIATRLCEKTQSVSDLFTYAKSVYLKRFGINNLDIPVSLICRTESFLNFFLHIVGNIKNFAKIYNAKLDEYRRLKKTRSKANPLPNLEEKEDVIELPFWIWKENGPRERIFASITNDRQVDLIFDNKVKLNFDSSKDSSENIEKLKSLEDAGVKIRPKAVTNTMYSRMFFSDIFIHGIGGAKYDLITDKIIKDFFGVEPPAYATISATLHLPYRPYDISHNDARSLKQTIKDMDRNPEKYISTDNMEAPEIQSLINEKKALITKKTHYQTEKRQTFNRLKELNDLIKEKTKPLIEEKEKETEEIEKKLRYNSIVTNREYPFCIYPELMLDVLFK